MDKNIIPLYMNRCGDTVTLEQVYEFMSFYDSALEAMDYLLEDVTDSQAFNTCLSAKHKHSLFFISGMLQRMKKEVDSVLCPDHMRAVAEGIRPARFSAEREG